MTSGEPKRTPLAAIHEKLGAKMVDFHGWWMPLQYEGILKEHQAVRERAGLFDICHMGEIAVRGKGAAAFLQKLMTNDFSKLQAGQCLYSPMCLPTGGIVDDTVTCKLSDEDFLVVVNASNEEKDFAWFLKNKTAGAQIENVSATTGFLALQGPRSGDILKQAFGSGFMPPAYYHFQQIQAQGIPLTISRTGYTGEMGFEIFCEWEKAPWLWEKLMAAGKSFGIAPIGLGARDTLRLEMKYALYGNDIDENTTPLEAGLGWAVSFEKGDFIGRRALLAQKETGIGRRLVGFQLEEPGIARHGFAVWNQTRQIGGVTSGTMSPTLGKSIGLAYVDPDHAEVGTAFMVEVRGRKLRAKVVKTPFVVSKTK